MNAQRVDFLTRAKIRGYLFLLFPSRRMERDLHRSRQIPSHEAPSHHPATERLDQHRSLSKLARLARSTRVRIGAAILALGGGAMTENRTDAATILPGQVVENVYGEQPNRVIALDNFNANGYRVTTADGAADDTTKWLAWELSDEVHSAGYAVDAYIESPTNPPATVVAPDQVFGEVRTKYFMVLADLPELASVQYGIAVTGGPEPMSLDIALRNATVYAGFGQMTGEPHSLEDAMHMTEYVMIGQYPPNVYNNAAWAFAQLDEQPPGPGSPEPATVYLAAMGIGVAALANRRRAGQVLRTAA